MKFKNIESFGIAKRWLDSNVKSMIETDQNRVLCFHILLELAKNSAVRAAIHSFFSSEGVAQNSISVEETPEKSVWFEGENGTETDDEIVRYFIYELEKPKNNIYQRSDKHFWYTYNKTKNIVLEESILYSSIKEKINTIQ